VVFVAVGAILICLGLAGGFDIGGVLSRRLAAVGTTARGRGFLDHPLATRLAFALGLVAIGVGWLVAGLQ